MPHCETLTSSMTTGGRCAGFHMCGTARTMWFDTVSLHLPVATGVTDSNSMTAPLLHGRVYVDMGGLDHRHEPCCCAQLHTDLACFLLGVSVSNQLVLARMSSAQLCKYTVVKILLDNARRRHVFGWCDCSPLCMRLGCTNLVSCSTSAPFQFHDTAVDGRLAATPPPIGSY